jgi:TM2 domain-containing membrane protein YozV
MEWDEFSVGEIFIAVATVIYIIFLNEYKLKLLEIQKMYTGTIDQAFAVTTDPDYFNYFFLGLGIIVVLIGFSILHIKMGTDTFKKIVITLINVVLLVILLRVFMDPIVTSFAVVLACGGLFALSQS